MSQFISIVNNGFSLDTVTLKQIKAKITDTIIEEIIPEIIPKLLSAIKEV